MTGKKQGTFARWFGKSKDARNAGIEHAEKLTSTKEFDTSHIVPSLIHSDSESSTAMESGRKRKLFDRDHLGDRITPEIAIDHIASFGDGHFRKGACSLSSPAKTRK
jgi:hypothetical protein